MASKIISWLHRIGSWIVTLFVCLLLFAFFGSEAWAEELNIRLTAGGYSRHLLSENFTNDSHDHFAVQLWNVELGRFNNSYGRESWYLAYEATWDDLLGEDWEVFIKSGVVYGYVDCLDRGSAIPKKRTPLQVSKAIQGANAKVIEGNKEEVDTSGAWCPMIAPGLRYTGWELANPELTLVGDAVSLGVSREFDLMSWGKP